MTILNLPAFSFDENQSNSFGKVLIWFEAIVKLDSHLDRWIGNKSFFFFFPQIAQKIWLSSVCHDNSLVTSGFQVARLAEEEQEGAAETCQELLHHLI